MREDTVWDGEYRVEGKVTVENGVRLTITAGSHISFHGSGAGIVVEGGITAEGEEGKPILFRQGGEDLPPVLWQGITVKSPSEPSRFSFCEFSGAEMALAAYGTDLSVEGVRFEDLPKGVTAGKASTVDIRTSTFLGNGVGVEALQNSRLTVEGSRFRDNAVGVVLVSGSSGAIGGNTFHGGRGVQIIEAKDLLVHDNLFSDSVAGLIAERAGPDVQVSSNRFEKGKVGIRCLGFCAFEVLCNRFTGLDGAILLQNFSRPRLENNLLSGNALGMVMGRKSRGQVSFNRFEGNVQAVFLDFSSYPVIEGNVFSGNDGGIVLGKYMSADWEKSVGSRSISLGRAAESNSRRLQEVGGTVAFSGKVDARRNWWGSETTAEMERLGEEGNVGAIEDYFDQHEVSYKGYEGTYEKDRVLYAPWLTADVDVAGPAAAACAAMREQTVQDGDD